jgi:hypothetical protein
MCMLTPYCSDTFVILHSQMVGSAPGFPHGLVDPIEVFSSIITVLKNIVLVIHFS